MSLSQSPNNGSREPNEINTEEFIRTLTDTTKPSGERNDAWKPIAESNLPREKKAELINGMLQDGDDTVRWYGTIIADTFGNEETIKLLQSMRETDNPNIREFALGALVRLQGAKWIPELLEKIHGTDPFRSAQGLAQLMEIDKERAVQELREVWQNHPNEFVRFCGALYLAYTGHDDGKELLIRHIEADLFTSPMDVTQSGQHMGALVGLSIVRYPQAVEKLSGYLTKIGTIHSPYRSRLLTVFRSILHFKGDDNEVVTKAKVWLEGRKI